MILVLALDALDPDWVGGLRSSGRLPNLSRLMEGGWSGRLRSTAPPVSVPAWSTFLTGVGPGRHGLFDFTRLENGRVRFQSGADRGVPTLLELADDAGRRVASLGLPTTYPVPRLRHGIVLAGFDSPFTGAPDPDALTPREFWRRARAEGLDLRTSTVPEGRKGRDWHTHAARGILDSVERRLAQALRVLGEAPLDLAIVHFQAADTAGHHFARYFDAASPRYEPCFADRARVIPQVYDALDRAVGALTRACPGSDVVLLSDHGMGPASDRVCHLNRWLEEQGFLVRRARSLSRLAESTRSAAVRRLPRGIQTRLFRWLRGSLASRLESRVRVGSLDLERSRAFSEESSTLPGVWVLDPSCKEELIRSLRRWEAVRRVHRREDLYRGPLRGRAPDILLELRHSPTRTPPGYLGPSLRKLEGWELDGERGRGLNGVHRPEGLVAVRGPGFPGRGAITGAWIGDLAPTLLARMQIEIPSWMEGQPLSPLNDEPAWCDRAPDSFPGKDPQTHTMTRVERARLERRLRALGYLG